jgi:hypothetical protein
MAPTNVGSPVCGGPDWFYGNSYNLNDVITPQTANGQNCTYYASGAGTSGGTHPTWLSGTTCLSPVTDGGVTWTLIGKQNMGIDVFIVGTIPYGSSPPSAPLGLVPQVFTKNNPPWRDSLGGNSQ